VDSYARVDFDVIISNDIINDLDTAVNNNAMVDIESVVVNDTIIDSDAKETVTLWSILTS
jgi:hypothetical protein